MFYRTSVDKLVKNINRCCLVLVYPNTIFRILNSGSFQSLEFNRSQTHFCLVSFEGRNFVSFDTGGPLAFAKLR